MSSTSWKELRKKAFRLTKKALRESVGDDQFVIQTISTIDELNRSANTLVKRLREWYELYSPEFSASIGDQEAFVRLILEKTRPEQLKEIGIEETMGADIEESDLEQILILARSIKQLFELRGKYEEYLETLFKRHAPNVLALTGVTIAGKLLREAGSLQKLATIQASTIQLYGAEKALFRHLKTGARPPKYGYLINHPIVTQAGNKDKGKAARALADKISIAAKVDFFHGEPIGEELRKKLEERFRK